MNDNAREITKSVVGLSAMICADVAMALITRNVSFNNIGKVGTVLGKAGIGLVEASIGGVVEKDAEMTMDMIYKLSDILKSRKEQNIKLAEMEEV